MKNLQQFSAGVQYVSPSCKSVVLRSKETILTGSGNSEFYGGRNRAGVDMEDDDRYRYDF